MKDPKTLLKVKLPKSYTTFLKDLAVCLGLLMVFGLFLTMFYFLTEWVKR